ncbi:MAG: cysteine--tRNA ligase [Planctomycetes bacterium]|nr:cysteine--tRNA ligase [Planctomycetota bacterium]
MTIRVYNTLTRTKEPLQPVAPGKVGIYLCGPTVYDKAHIGHMVGPAIFDTIKRYLTYCGYDVTWVVNITDVDDKLIKKANDRGISMSEVAEENTADYLNNLAALGVDQIDHMPRATETMGEIIDFIQKLIDRGFAYEVDGDVFFDVGKDGEYGKLTNRTPDQLQGDGGEAAAKKRSAADFALWKLAKPDEPSWESPWGAGRPGWHIECSAMSRNLLGETFDIHGGGLDLIFPHHENEIAQSECCHGKPMANVWMHNGLLRREQAGKLGGRGDRVELPEDNITFERIEEATDLKEARSKGSGGLAEQIRELGGETIRFFLLRTHYRSTVLFSDGAVDEARTSLDTFYRFFERHERASGQSFYDISPIASRDDAAIDAGDDPLLANVRDRRDSFLEKMDDDFNTGGAISELFELVRLLNRFVDENNLEDVQQRRASALQSFKRGTATLRELSAILGLFLKPIEVSTGDDDALVGKLMNLLMGIRAESRKKKDFATADKIRDDLEGLGITLEDRKGETDWRNIWRNQT